MTDINASHIAQDFLDRQGEETIRGDIDALLTRCDLPCTLESHLGRVIVTDIEELRRICRDFVERLRVKQITHMSRRLIEAGFQDPDTLTATYETRYVRQGQLLTEDPYVGFIILRRRDDAWKFSNMQIDVGRNSPPSVVFKGM